MRFVSIDIGLHNLAVTVEECDISVLSDINRVTEKMRYRPDGTPTAQFQTVLNHVYECGTIVYMEKIDLVHETKKWVDDGVLQLLSQLLSRLVIFDGCDVFVIEKQLQGKVIRNNIAARIEHHIHSYLVDRYGSTREIYIYPSSNKTKILGAPKMMANKKSGTVDKMSKYQRKRWAEVIAADILTIRRDYHNYDRIFSSGEKKDDYCDTIVQLQSFKYKYYCAKNPVVRWNNLSVDRYVNDLGYTIADRRQVYSARDGLNVRCKCGRIYHMGLESVQRLRCECNSVSESVQLALDKYGSRLQPPICGAISMDDMLTICCSQNHIYYLSASQVCLHTRCNQCSELNIGLELCRYYLERYLGAGASIHSSRQYIDHKKLKTRLIYGRDERLLLTAKYGKSRGEIADLNSVSGYKIIHIPFTLPYSKMSWTITQELGCVSDSIDAHIYLLVYKSLDCDLDLIKNKLYHNGGHLLSIRRSVNLEYVYSCKRGIIHMATIGVESPCSCDTLDSKCTYRYKSGLKKTQLCGRRCVADDKCKAHGKIVLDITPVLYDEECELVFID